MKFSKYIYKAVTPVMALFQKQHGLPFKQDYDNLRSTREESAASAGTAQSERQLHRNQSAVCASHNVPSDSPSGFLLSELIIAQNCSLSHPRNVENGEFMRILRSVEYKQLMMDIHSCHIGLPISLYHAKKLPTISFIKPDMIRYQINRRDSLVLHIRYNHV